MLRCGGCLKRNSWRRHDASIKWFTIAAGTNQAPFLARKNYSALKSAGCLRIRLCKHQAIHSRRAHLHFQRNFCLGLLLLDFVSKEENILQVVSEKRKPREMKDLNYSENESQQFLVLLHFFGSLGRKVNANKYQTSIML